MCQRLSNSIILSKTHCEIVFILTTDAHSLGLGFASFLFAALGLLSCFERVQRHHLGIAIAGEGDGSRAVLAVDLLYLCLILPAKHKAL